MNVGIRELRDSLSRHLAQMRARQGVTVSKHGEAVARIVPVQRLIAEGRVEPARRPKRPAERGVRASGTVSDLVADQRREVDRG